MTASWRTSFYDRDAADPRALRRLPDAEVVEAAGCARTAEALRRAVALRDEYLVVRDELHGRDAALAAAKAADAAEHAHDLEGKLVPRHMRRAEEKFDALQRRKDALAVAVPAAIDETLQALEAEREQAMPNVTERRALIHARIADAVAQIHAQYDEMQTLFDTLGWLLDWPAPRWQRPLAPLGSIKVGAHRDVKLGEGLALFVAWGAELEAVPPPGQEPQSVGIHFGTSRIGQMPVATNASIKTS